MPAFFALDRHKGRITGGGLTGVKVNHLVMTQGAFNANPNAPTRMKGPAPFIMFFDRSKTLFRHWIIPLIAEA